MGIGRRGFIKLAGLTTLAGAIGQNPSKLFAEEVTEEILKPVGDGSLKRYAMVIDLAKCRENEHCEDCMHACHKVHNVPKFDNDKDEIKWIWKDHFKHAFHEEYQPHLKEDIKNSHPVLLCNHCDNPPCVRVCPTKATWKRDKDGIVMMDMHRCIGCRYCMAACPYGSRSFNWRDPRPAIPEIDPNFPTRMRGVVEKCNFCADRLARGGMPACVEACQAKAIAFGDLEDSNSAVRQILADSFTIRRKVALGTNPMVYYIV